MFLKLSILFLYLFLGTSSFGASNPWSEMTLKDLEAIFSILKTEHPGAVDTENPWFKEHMFNGFEKAKKDASFANSYDDYEAVLLRYISGFKDGHLGVKFALAHKSLSWPGFVIALQGDSYRVVNIDQEKPRGLPQKGWALQSCDGLSPQEIMKRHVFPTQRGIEELESHWQILSPYLLQGPSHRWRPKYRKCIFSDGKNDVLLAIEERQIDQKSLSEMLASATLGDSKKMISRRRLRRDIEWISLPTFSPSEKGVSYMQSIAADMKKLRSKEYIVFDVRGNGGGSSLWGYEMLSNLYGKDYFVPLMQREDNKQGTYAEWRVSEGNLRHLRWIQQWLKDRHGEKSDGYIEFSNTLANMEEAIKKNALFSRQGRSDEEKTMEPSPPKSKAKLIVLTDGDCASACLDFLDMLSALPDVTHIGATTGADTLYMEVRGEDLPSSLANLRFATKVYRNRKRGHNVDYKPKFRWNGAIGDTAAIEKWVVSEIVPALRKER